MAGTLDFNPHEAPPQELKDVFKLWKGQLTPERDQNLNENVGNMRRLDSIPCHRLVENFNRFSGHSDDANETDVIKQVALNSSGSVYSSQVVPGMKLVHKTDSISTISLLIFPSLLPPITQRTLLSHLLHRDLSNPNYKTNLHLHYDVNYPEQQASFFSTDPNAVAFRPKDPAIHPPLTVNAALEKKLRWTTLGGQYDWTNKVYPAEEPPSFPSDIAELLQNLFPDMVPEAAIVNLYSPGDTLSLHRDVSEAVDRGLVSVSLGCDAVFIIGLQDKTSGAIQHEVLRLRSGDAVYMSGEARVAWHGVAKIVPGTCPDYLSDWPGKDFPEWKNWMRNKRINLNVRQMRE